MKAIIHIGDCREIMATLPDASVDAVVCDPPYHLTSIVDRFGKPDAAPSKVPEGGTGAYARVSRGFMGQTWDGGDVAFRVETWREVLRVLKPGGHLLAFSGSRTYHRMTCAIEDAGFEIRDQIMWVYGSGFPKSLDVSKAIDKAAGANSDARRWSGWGTALKPAHEPICMARKPLVGTVATNVLRHGTGAINVDGCRIAIDPEDPNIINTESRGGTSRSIGGNGTYSGGSVGRGPTLQHAHGRWPANFIHDGSDEATFGLGDAARFFYSPKASRKDRDEVLGKVAPRTGAEAVGRIDGSAGMKSPGAGAGRSASNVINHHPTVKPTELMRYLVRMVTPPGGTVLDPFTGSGSTGRGAMLEGMRFIGCELSPEYAEIAIARIRYVLGPMMAHEVGLAPVGPAR